MQTIWIYLFNDCNLVPSGSSTLQYSSFDIQYSVASSTEWSRQMIQN